MRFLLLRMATRSRAVDFAELPVEVGDVVESGCIGGAADGFVGVFQHGTGELQAGPRDVGIRGAAHGAAEEFAEVRDACRAEFRQLFESKRFRDMRVDEIKRGDDPADVAELSGAAAGCFRGETVQFDEQLPEKSTEHGLPVAGRVAAFLQNAADAGGRFRMFFPVDDVPERFAAAAFENEIHAELVHASGEESRRVEIQEAPAGCLSGIALGQMHLL